MNIYVDKNKGIKPIGSRFINAFIFIFLMIFIQTPMMLALSIIGLSVEVQDIYTILLLCLIFIIWTSLVIWITRKYYHRHSYERKQFSMNFRDLGFNVMWCIIIFIGNGFFSFIMGHVYHNTESKNNSLLLEHIKKVDYLDTQIVIGIIIFIITIVFIAPYLEELTFRGIFKETIFNKGAFIAPLLLSSALFSINHGSENIIAFFMYMFMGCCLYMAYNRRSNIKDSILVHIINNFCASIVIIFNLIMNLL